MVKNKDNEALKMNKKAGIIWVIIIVLLVVGGEIAFLIALSGL